MNILSLFDGMSCGHIALDRAGIEVDKYYASEIKPHAIKCTQNNYPKTIQLGDVTKWKEWDIDFDSIDMVIGGSPCQDFSQANREKKGLEGDKSSLFNVYKEILDYVKPKYFLLENVMMDEENYNLISNSLDVIPTEIDSKLISAQSRKRVYWTNIGTRENLFGMMFVDIPQPKDKGIKLIDVLEKGYTPKKKARTLLESDSRPGATPIKMFHRFYGTEFANLIFKSRKHYIDCKNDYDMNYKDMSAADIDETEFDRSVYDGLRFLTRTESEICQTVPIGYTSCLTENEAKSLLGDGWTVDVIAHIFSHLKL